MSRIHYAPLSSGFMLISILGFLVSVIWLIDKNLSWGFTLTLFFVIMFISSLVSMTNAETIPVHLDELAIHEPKRKLVAQGKHYIPKPIKKYTFHYFDIVFLIYFVLAIYYGAAAISYSTAAVNPVIFTVLLTLTIIIGLAMIIEIISSEVLEGGQQTILVLLILLTLPVGMMIYYIVRKFI